ncbi:YheC/YheD family protein [Paenibacillus albicereus]|uniref:YheC/YheD family protein n=1 Tax=Paenibacillus albicereus TaxID=2726185 RepID=A0A6H2H035_9BACL|nr:YheC/YheD family protein [Paenibacillus albicereus]QJC53030.1 YheC/YheD family protein [Paenibacillus albicereus]
MESEAGVIGVWIGKPPEPDGSGRLAVPEDGFLAALAERAAELRLPLHLFAAEGFRPETGALTGYVRESGCWQERQVALPAVVYDRCGPSAASSRRLREERLEQMRRLRPHTRLSSWLPGKLAQLEAMRRSGSELAALAPPTRLLIGAGSIQEAAREWGAVFLKPDGGMQGRGVLSLGPDEGGWLLRGRAGDGRTLTVRLPDLQAAAERTWRIVQGRRYILQPQLPLCDRQGRPFDVRALVQKDGRGFWRLTGTALRRGRPGGIASNLHGGGEALPARDGLELLLGAEGAARCSAEIDRLALLAAEAAESAFGRLAELGLDFGVGPDGRLWLLELNSRPGRDAFSSFPGGIARTAVERPLLYARLLGARLVPERSGEKTLAAPSR